MGGSVEALGNRYGFLAKHLENRQYLLGDSFTVADAYLFTILTWSPVAKLDLAKWPALKAYFDRVQARPAVQAALEMEKQARTA